MVMVVADAILVTGRRTGGLDASDDPVLGERCKRVVDGLERDRPDLRPYSSIDVSGSAVRSFGHGAQNSEALGRDLHAAFVKQSSLVEGFSQRTSRTLATILE